MHHDHDDHEPEDHDRGLAFDVSALRLLSRRRALALFSGVGLAAFVGCSSKATDLVASATSSTASATGATTGATTASTTATTATTAATTTSAALATTTSAPTTTSTAAASCDEVIPEETAGPYPGDGSNGPNVLAESGIVRRDIRSSFGTSTTVAGGVPMTVTLRILDNEAGCVPLAGAAVYAWHCDREGRYSMYSEGVTEENYLRGVQETAADGTVTFTSVFPAAYSGRWPHVHFEVYPSLAEATGGGSPRATSQVALPADASNAVYATAGYEASVANMARTSLDNDNVFSDGYTSQLGVATGDAAAGYVITLDVPV